MFKYTNTVVINSDKDSLSGLDKWVAEDNYMEVRRVMKFEKPYVTAIYKREGREGKKAKVTLKMPVGNADTKGYYRLALYIRLSGSQNSYYSNDFVFKGKPFYVEFEVKDGDTASAVAKRVAKLAKHLQQMYDNKYMNYKAEGDNLVIEGIDEFQRFTQADIQKFNPELGVNKVGEYETLHSAKAETSDDYEEGYTIEQGVEAFGDYFHILKDLRLPTVENTSWTSINAEEMPTIGALYNQYTIYYEKNRGQVGGGGAVGEVIVSQTTHVFYVQQSLASSFETALATIIPITNIVNGQVDNNGGAPENTLALSSSLVSLVNAGTGQDITVTSNAEVVKAASVNDWITVNVIQKSGETPAKVSVSASANDTGKKRNGKVIITAGDQSKAVSVSQAAS